MICATLNAAQNVGKALAAPLCGAITCVDEESTKKKTAAYTIGSRQRGALENEFSGETHQQLAIGNPVPFVTKGKEHLLKSEGQAFAGGMMSRIH